MAWKTQAPVEGTEEGIQQFVVDMLQIVDTSIQSQIEVSYEGAYRDGPTRAKVSIPTDNAEFTEEDIRGLQGMRPRIAGTGNVYEATFVERRTESGRLELVFGLKQTTGRAEFPR